MNLNKVFLIGRLTRDPESRALPSGQSVSSFGMATNRVWIKRDTKEKQEQTEFHNIVAFGKLADICNQYLKKGGLAMIEGRLQTRNWQGQNGETKYRTEIVAEGLQLGPRSQSSETAKQSKEPTEAQSQKLDEIQIDESSLTEVGATEDKENPGDEVKTEDIPF
jgi:single-strand DNA-binding protein